VESRLVASEPSLETVRCKWPELLEELAAARAELALAEQASEVVGKATALADLADSIVRLVVGAVGFEAACLLTGTREGVLLPAAYCGVTEDQRRLVAARLAPYLGQSPASAGQGGARLPATPAETLCFTAGDQNVVAVRLQVATELVGALVCLRPVAAGATRERELVRLHIVGRQVAVALKNARLAEDLRALFLHTVQALAAAIDAKDRYTQGHSERVSELGRELGTAMGLDEQRVEDLYLAGALHDVGKIAVPERVLAKQGRLDDLEWEDMRSHPARGAEIVGHVPELTRLMPAIRHHHEQYGGNGYPDGLTGGDIPEDARILAICDAFDAITSQRTYRAARSPMAALGEIHRHRGSQFDPEVAELFIEHAARSDLLIRIVGRPPVDGSLDLGPVETASRRGEKAVG